MSKLSLLDPHRLCKNRQIRWATERGLQLQGSKGPRGEPAYTITLDENLFVPLSPQSRLEFEAGDGNELESSEFPCKMQAVHSSASIVVNVFEYWRQLGDLSPLAEALGLAESRVAEIQYEAKLPIMDDPRRYGFPVDPNLDVCLALGDLPTETVGIESKFTELYRKSDPSKKGMSYAYLRHDSLWDGLPACRRLAEGLSPNDNRFKYLHAAQLLKHLLGLRYKDRRIGGTCQLMYLWYDTETDVGRGHRKEVDQFTDTLAEDGVTFRTFTFQEVISSLSAIRGEHETYVAYLVDRYLE